MSSEAARSIRYPEPSSHDPGANSFEQDQGSGRFDVQAGKQGTADFRGGGDGCPDNKPGNHKQFKSHFQVLGYEI